MNVAAALGLQRFDSDDDEEGDGREFYVFSWRPEVGNSGLASWEEGGQRGIQAAPALHGRTELHGMVVE